LLTPSAYGAASLVGTATSLVSVFALAGIDMSYARAYYSSGPPSGEAVEHFCWRIAIFTAAPAAVLAGLAWWFVNKGSVELDQHLAILLALGVFLTVINMMSQTRARLEGKYRAMARAVVVTGLVGAAAGVGIAALWRRDAVALIIPVLLANLIPILMLGIPPVSELATPSRLGRKEGMTLMKIGLAGVVTAPMYWLLSSSDRWFLQLFHGADSVGVYSLGYNFAFLGVMVNTAVMTVWLPEAAREYEEDPEMARVILGRLMSRLVAGMALVWLAVASAGGDVVRWLANSRFHAAADVVPFIAGGVFFYGVSQLALYGLLLVKQLKWAAVWWFAGGLVCVALNLALVPRLGGIGAAITQSISFAFVAFAILTTSQIKYRLELTWLRLAAVMAIVLGAALVMVPPWSSIPPLSIVIKFPVGVAVSALVAWVIAPDWWRRGVELVRLRTFDWRLPPG
ncbi:MAG: lipopolysaccharide biosynthesis protein, partial [Acidobacteriota bacterium]